MKNLIVIGLLLVLVVSCNNEREIKIKKLTDENIELKSALEKLELELSVKSRELEEVRKEAEVQLEMYLELKSKCK
ncbi:MAG: hypothetical protein ACK4RF_07255 [Cyclobacteriaceae bacterium]